MKSRKYRFHVSFSIDISATSLAEAQELVTDLDLPEGYVIDTFEAEQQEE